MSRTIAMPAANHHVRLNLGVLAAPEKRTLIWIASRLPAWVGSDHLSALGMVSMLAAGVSFAYIAVSWFESLAVSGQSRYYEQSDVATAVFLAESMSRTLAQPGKVNANAIAAVMSGMSSLLVTEGDRRRLRLELERTSDEPDQAALDATADMDAYRQRLRGSGAG